MVRFSIFGITVHVQPFFWITLALIGALWNPELMYGSSPEAILQVCLFVIAGFISILVHELGHALAAKHFGAHCEIVLQSLGGYAAYSGVRMTRPQSFLITAAGPAIQILLALIILFILRLSPEIKPLAAYFVTTLIGISLVWAVFNLFPILPLDGGRMVEAVLGPKRIRITLWISLVTAVLLGIFALISTGSIIAPIFLGMFAWQSWKALQQLRGK